MRNITKKLVKNVITVDKWTKILNSATQPEMQWCRLSISFLCVYLLFYQIILFKIQTEICTNDAAQMPVVLKSYMLLFRFYLVKKHALIWQLLNFQLLVFRLHKIQHHSIEHFWSVWLLKNMFCTLWGQSYIFSEKCLK